MSIRKYTILIFISIPFCRFASAQEPQVKKDSTTIYRDIKSFSRHSKFTGSLISFGF